MPEMMTEATKAAPLVLNKKAYGAIAILVVEDAAHMASLVCGILKSLGVGHIYEARNGDDALDILSTFPVDAILIDDLKPPLDGLTVVKTIRKAQAKPPRDVPVIFMTSQLRKSEIIAARDAGVTEVLSRPFSAAQLVARLESVLVKPRPLVETAEFVGPDRRRRAKVPDTRRRLSDAS